MQDLGGKERKGEKKSWRDENRVKQQGRGGVRRERMKQK